MSHLGPIDEEGNLKQRDMTRKSVQGSILGWTNTPENTVDESSASTHNNNDEQSHPSSTTPPAISYALSNRPGHSFGRTKAMRLTKKDVSTRLGFKENVKTPRQVVEEACATNAKLGHENLGSLSWSHGFSPRLTPVTKFPPEFQAWNVLHDKLPYLLSSDKLRQYCDDELPLLDATKLHPMFALRAANVLGFTAHAYWNIMGRYKATKLPPSLDVPWRVINSQHLERDGEPFLCIFENIVCNFQFTTDVPKLPTSVEPCPWASDEYAKYGAVDYDINQATVDKFIPSNFFTGLEVEHYFFGIMCEMNHVAAPMIGYAVQAGEAVASNSTSSLKKILVDVKNFLLKFTFESFNKIQQQPKAPCFVDGTLWPKVVAPIAVPITSTSFGPSGTSEPIFHLLDAFFGRIHHKGFIGKEIKHLFHSFPIHWRNFLTAVWKGPSVREFVAASDDLELQGLFAAALRAYAADDGFLGRHRLKMVGYLEVRFKITRATVISGVSGVFLERTWDRIGEDMKLGQAERLALPLKATAKKINKGSVVLASKEDALKVLTKPTIHFRINIEGSGLQYSAGSHIGVLYESSDAEVEAVLLAMADGNIENAQRLGDEHMVPLNDKWKRSIRSRPEYHDCIHKEDTPDALNLRTFLKWGCLRPASREMLRLAYRASLADDIRAVLDSGLEEMLTFADVVTMLQRQNVRLVKLPGRPTSVRNSTASVLMTEQKLADLHDVLTNSIGEINIDELNDIFGTAGTEELTSLPKTARSSISGFINMISPMLSKPDLCEIVQPNGFRMYSVASSPTVHPTELHLHVSRVFYSQKSPTSLTSPLLADLQPLENRRGAASDFIFSKSIPRDVLAMDTIIELAGVKRNDDLMEVLNDTPFFLTDERQKYVQSCASIADDEMKAIIEMAKNTSDGGDLSAGNLVAAAEKVLADKPDPRDRSVILIHHPSPRFRLPVDIDTPCIMIAGGTGMAPFRSFWQELATRSNQRRQGAAKHLLLIQQRDRSAMAFEEEMYALVKAGIMDVEILFSRDAVEPDFSGTELVYKDAPGRTGYLDKIIRGRMQQRIVSGIAENGAYVYVCGRGGLATTVVDALADAFETHYGAESGKDEMERMVAENRFILDIFTTLASPMKLQRKMYLSELVMRNDFVGNRSTSVFQGNKGSKSHPWLFAVGASVYDVTEFVRLHPGGDALLKLYCGMDATKAWEAITIGHSKAPEVAAMLQMLDTKMTFHRSESTLASDEGHWYRSGWFEVTQMIVEVQNSVAIAYQKNWDEGYMSSAERDLGSGFTVWNGKATWRPKRSVFKGRIFSDIHHRFWFQFLPTLFGPDFRLMIGYNAEQAWQPSALLDMLLTTIPDLPEHEICDATCEILAQEVAKAALVPDTMEISSDLQAFMEEVRVLDEMLLENIKKALVIGLRVFERNKSPLLPTFEDVFEKSLMGIGNAVESYIKELASITVMAFGMDRIKEAIVSDGFERGGMLLVSKEDLAEIQRTFMDDQNSLSSSGGLSESMSCPFTPQATPELSAAVGPTSPVASLPTLTEAVKPVTPDRPVNPPLDEKKEQDRQPSRDPPVIDMEPAAPPLSPQPRKKVCFMAKARGSTCLGCLYCTGAAYSG